MSGDNMHDTAVGAPGRDASPGDGDASTGEQPTPGHLIDSRLPKWNQGVLAAALVISFAVDFWYAVAAMALVLGLGTALGPKANPVMLFFLKVLRPRLHPPTELEDPRPPRFAALVGTVFLVAATALFAAGLPVPGWVLTGIVAVLAGLAATTGLCVGCEIYVFVRRQFGSFEGPWRVPADKPPAPRGAGA